MKTFPSRSALCSCLLALPPFQVSQPAPSIRQGPASSLAAGLSVAPTASEATVTRVKAPLNQTSPPPSWSRSLFPSGPDYSMTAMFGSSLAAVIRLGAESTGNDSIPPIDENGVPDVRGRGTWMGVTVSVANNAVGLQGSLIRQRRNRLTGRNTPGADLITYYYDESLGIDPRLVNTTILEQSSEQIGFSGNEDVDGLDFGLGMISHARDATSTLLFTNERDFFFTLTRACLAQVNAYWYSLTGTTADEATVYRIMWDEAGGGWSAPTIYLNAGDLGLVPGEDEIDALAVDPGTHTTIFSTKLDGTGRSQLMVHGLFEGISMVNELVNYGGARVSNKLGSNDGTDDIDAVCVIDPERNQLETLLGFAVGTLPAPPIPDDPMGLSVCRSRALDGGELLHAQVSGFGPNAPADGFVAFYFSFDALPEPVNWLDGGLVWRPSTENFVERTYPIPPAFYANPTTVMAAALDVNGNLAKTWMCRLKVDTLH